MARPTKRGLDYFPMDCIQDDNLTFIEAKHGIEGFGILIKIWQKIYRNDGYYMQWNEQNMYLFAREIAVSIDVISSVVNTCLLPNISIFNADKYEQYGILTSTGIQKRWLSIVKSSKRKGVQIDVKFDLLELTPVETLLTPVETTVYTSESTQTILNDNKREETITNEIPKNENYDFINELVRDFEFTENRFNIQAKKIMEFVNVLSFNNTLDHFKIQYRNYREFKKLSGQTSHNFYSFIGTSDKKYQDGAWNIDNWEAKLKTEKLKTNGTKNQSTPGRRSNLNPNPTAGYSKL